MGDDRLDIESGLEETSQAIPGFEQSAACNAVDANPFKNDFIGEIARDRAGRNAEECDASAVLDGTEGLMQGGRVSRHFERGIDTFAGGNVTNGGSDPVCRLGLGVDEVIGPDLFGKIQAIRADIRGDDDGGAGRSRDGGRKESGLRETIPAGILAGFPVVDVKVTLFDGSYHDVDSNENAFKMAASIGFKDGMRKADPILLEPMMAVEIETPEDYMGDIMGDLSSRRGMIQGMEDNATGKGFVQKCRWRRCLVTQPRCVRCHKAVLVTAWNLSTILKHLETWRKPL